LEQFFKRSKLTGDFGEILVKKILAVQIIWLE